MATFSDDYAAASLTAGNALTDGGKLAIYDVSNVKLVELALSNPSFLTVASRQQVADAISAAFAIANGTASYAILTKVDGTTEAIRVVAAGSSIITARASNTLTLNDVSAFSVDAAVKFFMVGAGALPTNIVEGTTYYIKTISGNDITLSTAVGGATFTISGAGSGVQRMKAALTELALSAYNGALTIGNQVSVSSLVIAFGS